MYLFLGPVVLGLLPKEISYIQGIYTNSIYVCVHSCFSHVQLSVTLLTVAHHAPPSMGFFRQGYWNGLPFPAPRDLPYPGIKLTSPRLWHCRRILYPLSHMESPNPYISVVVVLLLSCAWLFVTLWTLACQAPLSMGFFRQGYWNGLPCPPPGDLPDPGIEPVSPALAGKFFITTATREAPVHGNFV